MVVQHGRRILPQLTGHSTGLRSHRLYLLEELKSSTPVLVIFESTVEANATGQAMVFGAIDR